MQKKKKATGFALYFPLFQSSQQHTAPAPQACAHQLFG